MAINLSNFKEGTTIADTDFFVGYTNSKKSGERRWKWSTIFNKLDTTFHTAKAWVNFNGDGQNGKMQIRSQFNVASVTRFQDGLWKIVYTQSVGANRIVTGLCQSNWNVSKGIALNIARTDTVKDYASSNTPLTADYVWIQAVTVRDDGTGHQDSPIITVAIF